MRYISLFAIVVASSCSDGPAVRACGEPPEIHGWATFTTTVDNKYRACFVGNDANTQVEIDVSLARQWMRCARKAF